MQEYNYSFEYYTAITFTRGNMAIVKVNKSNPKKKEIDHVVTRSFSDIDYMYAWSTGYTKEQNANSIRTFLENKPIIYRDCFEMSLNGFILTAETLKMVGSLNKFVINNLDRTEFFKKTSIYRIGCILSLMSRWGVLWEFQEGKFVNIVRGL